MSLIDVNTGKYPIAEEKCPCAVDQTDYTRYQYQPWYIKLYRQIRHRPVGYLLAVCDIAWWVAKGCKRIKWGNGFAMSRWEVVKHLWIMNKSSAQYNMGYWYTIEEVISDLLEKASVDISESGVQD